jgi:DNA primase catalytic core
VWRAVSRTEGNDLRPTGDRTIGAPGAHQAKLNRAVHKARPNYPFSQRTWYRALPEPVRQDPWITPLCQRLARLERAGLPVTDYIRQALASDPSLTAGRSDTNTNADTVAASRPLPDEQQAAALWWRLVPHLGPAALGADEHSANLLQPTWRPALATLVGTSRAAYLQQAPAWPALVAAVDEACQHHGWTPTEILSSALAGIPQDGSLTGVEVADAFVLHIAMLTDQPTPAPMDGDETAPYGDANVPPDLLPPNDADDFMAAYYRDHPDDPNAPLVHSPDQDEHKRLPGEPYDWTPPLDEPVQLSYGDAAANLIYADDPYAPPLPWQREEADVEHAFPDQNEIPPARIHELNQQALTYYQSCYHRSWAPDYLNERLGTDLADHPTYSVGYAPGSGQSLMRHLTNQGATVHELEQAGLVSMRERNDGTTYFCDFLRDRLVMPIRDPHDPAGAILGFIGRRNPTKSDDDKGRNWAGPKYLNTRTTPVFTKGEALFGYAEVRDLLANGALPIIVEGPMDALAITLGGGGTAAGIAPMGTALTISQIKLLLTNIDLVSGRNRIAVATDNDRVGWTAAQKAFWHLTAADLDPTHLDLPDALDPAQLLQTHGPDAILAAIDKRAPLGNTMIDHLLRTGGHWSNADVRQTIICQAARILGSRGAETWAEAFERLHNRLQLAPGILEHQTITESMDRDRDRQAYAQARIDEINDQARANSATRDPGTARRATEQRLATAQNTPRPGHHQTWAGSDPVSGPAR